MQPITGLPPKAFDTDVASAEQPTPFRHWRCLPALLIVAVFLAATPSAIHVIREEALVTQASDRLYYYNLAEMGGARVDFEDLRGLPSGGPPRAVLAYANLVVRAAATDQENPRRVALLADAQRDVAGLLASRPHWADAWAVASAIAMQRGQSQASVAMLERSYQNANGWRGAGAGRAIPAFASWGQLSDRARARAVDEAVWLARIDKRVRDDLFSLARQSRAYRQLLLRWREMRLRNDAD